MKNNIKLVASFSHKDNSNIFSNVLVKSGFMTAQNGVAGISVKVDTDIDFCCNADRLSQALNLCDKDKMKLNIKNKRLYISSGRFKSNIALLSIDSYPTIENNGDPIEIQSDIISQIASIIQFTDPNDIRPALQGVAITNGFIKATNGHMAIKKEISNIAIDEVIIPSKSIQMIVKGNTVINSMMIKDKTVFFNFDDGYLFTKTIDQKMPDIDRILSKIEQNTDLSDLKESIKSMAPLCGGDKTLILGEEIKTRKGDSSIDGFNLPDCAFNVDYLLKIIDIADTIDFSPYPDPCPFEGDGIIGAVVGIL